MADVDDAEFLDDFPLPPFGGRGVAGVALVLVRVFVLVDTVVLLVVLLDLLLIVAIVVAAAGAPGGVPACGRRGASPHESRVWWGVSELPEQCELPKQFEERETACRDEPKERPDRGAPGGLGSRDFIRVGELLEQTQRARAG